MKIQYGVVNGTHISEVVHAMKNRFVVNLNRCLVALLTVVVSLTIAVTAISMGRVVVAISMAIITLIFIWQVIVNGSVVEIKNEGVETRFLGFRRIFISWDSISEVGVIGTKVFNLGSKKKTGQLYIYFSEESMNDDDRFELAMKWPPGKKIFFRFSQQGIDAVQIKWNKIIRSYNIGDLQF